jgi:hypothetical protein
LVVRILMLLRTALLSKVCNKTRPDAPDVRVAPTTRASVDVVANKTLPLAVESAAASSSSSASTSTALTVRSAAATTGTTSSTTQSALTESQTAITPPSTPARALSAQPSSDDVTRAVSATTSPATAAAGATSDGDDASLSRSRAIEHNARTPGMRALRFAALVAYAIDVCSGSGDSRTGHRTAIVHLGRLARYGWCSCVLWCDNVMRARHSAPLGGA